MGTEISHSLKRAVVSNENSIKRYLITIWRHLLFNNFTMTPCHFVFKIYYFTSHLSCP